METITFRQCTKELLKERFELHGSHEHPLITAWFELSATIELDHLETAILQRYQAVFIERVDDWNEFELAEYFLGPIIALVNFNTEYFCVFAERPIEAEIGDYKLMGKPDLMVATGESTPKVPYFCFSEYKKQIDPEGNPVYQALGAMLAARALNPHPHPIYGVGVMGKLWHFLVLQGNEYAISKGFLSDDEELFDIVKILKALKLLLLEIAEHGASLK